MCFCPHMVVRKVIIYIVFKAVYLCNLKTNLPLINKYISIHIDGQNMPKQNSYLGYFVSNPLNRVIS